MITNFQTKQKGGKLGEALDSAVTFKKLFVLCWTVQGHTEQFRLQRSQFLYYQNLFVIVKVKNIISYPDTRYLKKTSR